MSNLQRILTMTTLKALVLAASLTFLSTAQAASINYGNFGPVPPGITFLGVTESSGTDPVPLFGAPTPFSVGLDFDPTTFVAVATAGAIDITDGQLNFAVAAAPGLGIDGIDLFESGDYSLAGLGGPATQAIAGAIIRVTVTQINGINVAPISLSPNNASTAFGLPPIQIVLPWSLGTSLDIASQLGPNQLATRVSVVIDNQLLAISEPTSSAFIAKKDFVITIHPSVPEPSTIVLTGMGLVGLCVAGLRKKNRRA